MSTIQIDTGITGAKRQSWREANPRDVLKKLIELYPDDSEEEIKFKCLDIVDQKPAQRRTVFEYWFANNYRSLTKSTAPIPTPPTQRRQAVAEATRAVRQKIEEKVEEKAKIALLTMILPHGKQLQHSTREELIQLGGWAQRVAEKLRPGQTVMDAGLSESGLRALFGK